jgi:hypothetical protein
MRVRAIRAAGLCAHLRWTLFDQRLDNQSAAACNNFCPASDTKIVYGSSIDAAATETGKPYSELPNAFRYRNEMVAGCTCNGKDQVGLASVKIENDPTLRKGDIVAGEGGLVVANRVADKRGASLNFAGSKKLRARYQRRWWLQREWPGLVIPPRLKP